MWMTVASAAEGSPEGPWPPASGPHRDKRQQRGAEGEGSARVRRGPRHSHPSRTDAAARDAVPGAASVEATDRGVRQAAQQAPSSVASGSPASTTGAAAPGRSGTAPAGNASTTTASG